MASHLEQTHKMNYIFLSVRFQYNRKHMRMREQRLDPMLLGWVYAPSRVHKASKKRPLNQQNLSVPLTLAIIIVRV